MKRIKLICVLSCLCVAATWKQNFRPRDYVAVPSAPTPVFQFRMNDNAANQTVVENIVGTNATTKTGNTSTMSVPGKINTALAVGQSDYIFCPLLDEWAYGRTNLTLACWLYTGNNGTAGNGRAIMGYYYAAMCSLTVFNNKARFLITCAGIYGTVSVTSVTAIANGAWHHVAGTYNGSEIRIYVDGQYEGSGVITGKCTDVDGFAVGIPMSTGQAVDANYHLNATNDDVRLYNVTLTPTQISNVWNNGSGTED